jgi:hypothetical protein
VIVAGIIFILGTVFFAGAIVVGVGSHCYYRHHHMMFRPGGPWGPSGGPWQFGEPYGPGMAPPFGPPGFGPGGPLGPPPGFGPGGPGGPSQLPTTATTSAPAPAPNAPGTPRP